MIIISIGNEILFGKTINTNASFIADQLYTIGIEVQKVITIADDKEQIFNTITSAFTETDLIVMTGGLGPTKDDITKQVICDYFHVGQKTDDTTLKEIQAMFQRRGFTLNEINRLQASIPEGAIALSNKNGTAPGIFMEKDQKILIAMPGVPFEMKSIVTNELIPLLKNRFQNHHIVIHKEIITAGIGESALSELIEPWELALPKHITLAYLPSPGKLMLRLTGRSDHGEEKILNEELEHQLTLLKKISKSYIISDQNQALEEVIGTLLKQKKGKMAVAESCTGGYLAHLITSVPGSSEYFEGGLVSYSNHIKKEILNVRELNLKKHGAVSEFVVNDMAINTMGLFDVDYTIAISGIAGPSGGTPEKPVGTVWIAVADPVKVIAEKFTFGSEGGREVVIQRAARAALYMFYKLLKGFYH
ncbi:MAG: competence/damage-inducible protein A [Bacteroidales bacterium]|jgi:nicotinamide-nucleotide amidase|nr:competence/damage-inducible protein A [Bacteroidales bacterium]